MSGKIGFAVIGGTFASVCLATAAEAALLPYRFDKIAETGTAFQSLGEPALNDSNVAAYYAIPSVGPTGVYTGNQFFTQQVPVTGGGVSSNVVDINNAGQVAYAVITPRPPGELFDNEVIYRTGPDGTVTIGNAPRSVTMLSGGPVLNNNGLVAYATSGTLLSGVFTGDGSGPVTSPFAPRPNVFEPRLNNQGKAAAIAQHTGGRFLFYGNDAIVSLANFGPSTMYTDPDYGTPGTLRVQHVDVGDNDRVVFSARWNEVTDGIYLWQNGTISKVPGTNGLTGIPAVNDQGVVAGLVTGNGSTRLSIFENGGEDTLISVGAPFDGSTITELGFSPEGFNNRNAIAFLAVLADGRTVSVISSLPEPGAVSMLIGCGTLLLRRRSKVYRT
jgi:hypothetical protein